jgi:hypothetical protein
MFVRTSSKPTPPRSNRSWNTKPNSPLSGMGTHRCAFCQKPLQWWAAWRGREEHMYCNEFCAEIEDDTTPVLVPRSSESRPLRGGAPLWWA